jgi:hypothetical protein
VKWWEKKMHTRDAELHAFAEGQLDDASRERVQTHLDSCASCRERLERVRDELATLERQLALLAPGASQRPRAELALARLHAQITDNYKPLAGGIMLRKSGLSRNWQRALSGLAAVLVVAVLLSIAPVRAAASELLSFFRLEQVVILPVSIQEIERLERISYELGDDFFPGDTEIIEEPGDPQHPATVAEAGDLAGFPVRTPATHPAPDEIVVRGQMITRFEPDIEMMQLLFETAGLSPDLVPPEIDGEAFDFTMPVSVVQIWGDEEEALMVTQMRAPTVDYPDGIDEDALGEALLQLLGLSAEEAAAFSATIDWSTTLLVPLPGDQMSAEPVVVDGAEGYVITGDPSDGDEEVIYTAVLWQKNGFVHVVGGSEDAATLLEIANSLQ